jgi:hypothetical protein
VPGAIWPYSESIRVLISIASAPSSYISFASSAIDTQISQVNPCRSNSTDPSGY